LQANVIVFEDGTFFDFFCLIVINAATVLMSKFPDGSSLYCIPNCEEEAFDCHVEIRCNNIFWR